jgi:hypothetical protein
MGAFKTTFGGTVGIIIGVCVGIGICFVLVGGCCVGCPLLVGTVADKAKEPKPPTVAEQPPKPATPPPASPVATAPAPAKSSPPAPQEKAPKVHKEGDTVHVGYTSYAVWRSWWSSRLSSNQFLNQRPNALYLFVDLTVRNNDQKARIVPPFSLVDENGAEYEASSRGWAIEGSIGMLESLNPSVGKQGFIVFDVPQDHSYRLKLSGGYWSLEDAYVQLSPAASMKEARPAGERAQSPPATSSAPQPKEISREAQIAAARKEVEDLASQLKDFERESSRVKDYIGLAEMIQIYERNIKNDPKVATLLQEKRAKLEALGPVSPDEVQSYKTKSADLQQRLHDARQKLKSLGG